MAITPVTIQTEAQERKVFEPTKFMADLTNIQEAINTIILTLEDMLPDTSGAEYVNCRPVGTLNSGEGGSIYTMLDALFSYIGELQAGTIADGSIGEEKLSFDPVTAAELEAALADVQMEVTGGASTIIDADLTSLRVLISNSLGKVAVSTISSALLANLSGLTSNIQTQLNAKQATITGGASTIASSNLTASRALISNSSGKVAVSPVTDVELAYLDGVTSGIQAQLNGKQAVVSGVSNTEIGYLDGVTSAIQTQLNGKQATITGGASSIVSSNLTASRALVSDGSGKVAVSAVTSTELGYLDGVTSAIQTQLNAKLGSTAQAADSHKVDGHHVFVQSSAPTAGAVGDIWIDT